METETADSMAKYQGSLLTDREPINNNKKGSFAYNNHGAKVLMNIQTNFSSMNAKETDTTSRTKTNDFLEKLKRKYNEDSANTTPSLFTAAAGLEIAHPLKIKGAYAYSTRNRSI